MFKLRRICILLSALLLCVTAAVTECHGAPITIQGNRVIGLCRGDLDGNHTIETVAITCCSYQDGHPMGGEIVVLQQVDGVLKPVWRQPKLNPWKVQIADVDGDGNREIIAGVWKKSPKDPIMAKRTFVYSWNGKRMLPKWLGSRLSRRFDDFMLFDINNDGWDELLALEVAPGGKHRVAAYRWLVFGFDWLGCSSEMLGLNRIMLVKGKPVVSTSRYQLSIKYSDGKVKLKKGKGEVCNVKH